MSLCARERAGSAKLSALPASTFFLKSEFIYYDRQFVPTDKGNALQANQRSSLHP